VSSSSRSKYRSIEIVAGPALWPTIGWIVLAVVVQTSFAPLITVRGAVPALVMIPVVRYAMQVGAWRGAIAGLIAGVLDDAFGAGTGDWTLATTLVAAGAGRVGRGFFADGFVRQGLLVGLAVALRDLLFWALERLEGFPRGTGTMHVHASLIGAALTAALTIVYLVARGRFVVDRTSVERYP
jgi:rod shape-determining protein MreD